MSIYGCAILIDTLLHLGTFQVQDILHTIPSAAQMQRRDGRILLQPATVARLGGERCPWSPCFPFPLQKGGRDVFRVGVSSPDGSEADVGEDCEGDGDGDGDDCL